MVQPLYIQAHCLYIIVQYSVKSRHTSPHKDGHTENTDHVHRNNRREVEHKQMREGREGGRGRDGHYN